MNIKIPDSLKEAVAPVVVAGGIALSSIFNPLQAQDKTNCSKANPKWEQMTRKEKIKAKKLAKDFDKLLKKEQNYQKTRIARNRQKISSKKHWLQIKTQKQQQCSQN